MISCAYLFEADTRHFSQKYLQNFQETRFKVRSTYSANFEKIFMTSKIKLFHIIAEW